MFLVDRVVVFLFCVGVFSFFVCLFVVVGGGGGGFCCCFVLS